MGVNLKDVSYSVKQNGIMVNLDYSEPIGDDDIIGWKSDRGWVYLTLLGVRAPKNKIPQDNFTGAVRKIVIDDFDESTQLAILVKKPILGYDIINSKTSPSTIVFIHTEMKRSEVVSLKKHIKNKGTSVFNVAKSSGFPKYNTNFKNAFDEARKELGPNAIFEYHGNLYTTNHPGEKELLSKSILMKKSIGPITDGKFDTFKLRNMVVNSSTDSLLEEIYVNQSTGETLVEKIGDSVRFENLDLVIKDKRNDIKIKEDDGWFSGEFPSYDNTNKISPIPNQRQNPKDTLVIKEKPVMVESSSELNKKDKKNWMRIFNIFRKNDKIEQEKYFAENSTNDENIIEQEKPSSKSGTLLKLQKRYIPPQNENKHMETIDESTLVVSATQLSDTNVVAAIDFDKILQSKNSTYQKLQKTHIPDYSNMVNDTLSSQKYYASPTQDPDTNTVQAWFIDESIISDEYDATRLQQQYIPSNKDNMVYDSEILLQYETLPQNTQDPDTNTVQAWFIDESIISDEYDVTRLQQEYIPSNKNNMVFDRSEPSQFKESLPQTPEFTDPVILDRRLKTTYKNKDIVGVPRSDKEKPFKEDSTQNNTWLSYFPLQDDSIKNSLKWDFKHEREVPYYLQDKRESLDYSTKDNLEYKWREQLAEKRPRSFPKRQADPGFMYYHNGGIRVESNMVGVPIYIDGKFVGETPLSRPIQVEPGWHQVSGFSPVYTHLASQKGLQFVGYNDSIIQNNESYGATTVYAEAGKLETVELKFNKMGDTPKKWVETKGGMSVGLPMFVFVMSMILYGI